MKITERHIRFAKLVYEDELTDHEISEKCKISDRHLYVWKKKPEIQELIDGFAEADVRRAKKKLERASIKAAETLSSCLTCGEPETCRKAACNILESTELKQAEGAVNVKITE